MRGRGDGREFRREGISQRSSVSLMQEQNFMKSKRLLRCL